MKEYIGIAMNPVMVPQMDGDTDPVTGLEPGQIVAMSHGAEIVLLTNEPEYSMEMDGEHLNMIREGRLHQFRFWSSTKGMRELAESLRDAAAKIDLAVVQAGHRAVSEAIAARPASNALPDGADPSGISKGDYI